jgi:hypothetical protein
VPPAPGGFQEVGADIRFEKLADPVRTALLVFEVLTPSHDFVLDNNVTLGTTRDGERDFYHDEHVFVGHSHILARTRQ